MWSASKAWRRPNVYASTPSPASAGQRDRREQDDERGRARDNPAGDADPEQALEAERMVVAVVMVVAMIVGALMAPLADPPAQDGGADADDQQRRDEVEPRVEL